MQNFCILFICLSYSLLYSCFSFSFSMGVWKLCCLWHFWYYVLCTVMRACVVITLSFLAAYSFMLG